MKVPMQEFKSHLANYVRQSQTGKTLEITSHRRVVARLIGVPQLESTGVSRLLAAGIASWQGDKPKGATLTLAAQGKPVFAMVLEDRE